MTAIHPDQIKAAEAVMRAYITDPAISAAGAFMEALAAYMDAAPSKKKRQKPEGEAEGFDGAYAGYPRKVGRRAAAEAYGRALGRATPEIILAGIKRYAASVQGAEERFVAHMATWLNQDRWKDQLNGPEGLVGGAGAAFEDCSTSQWVTRLEIYAGKQGGLRGTWREQWGARPREEGCKVPQAAYDEFFRLYPRKAG